jgi:hypothetical protein
MSPLQPALDEVAKRWRLEHSHSVSAIHKSGPRASGPQGLRVPLLGYENRREDPCDTGDFKAYRNGAGTKGDPLLGRPHTSNLIGLDVSQVLCL